MLLAFCFGLLFVCSFYARNYLRRKLDNCQFAKKSKMSDDEFCDPAAAREEWQKRNASSSSSKAVSRWKRQVPAQSNKYEKRQRMEVDSQVSETIDLTVNDAEAEKSPAVIRIAKNPLNAGGLFGWLSKPLPNASTRDVDVKPKHQYIEVIPKKEITDNQVIQLTDDETDPSISDESPNISAVDSDKNSPDEKYIQTIPKSKPAIFRPKCKNVPLPPGMPPVIAGVPVKFPASPYRSQISVMNAVIKGCTKQEHCLLESPTGSGKTLALLCAALAWQTQFEESRLNEAGDRLKNQGPSGSADGCYKPMASEVDNFNVNSITKPVETINIPKIYYGSRTHRQIEQVVREFKKTAYSEKPMTILSSREHTCIHACPTGKSKTQLCNDLHDVAKQSQGRCPFNSEASKAAMSSHEHMYDKGFDTPWDIEDLVAFGRNHKACPYFGARGLMSKSDIIFCPYNYLIDPVIKDTMQLNLKGHIIIIDEAHNIESICRDVASADFREDNLGEAIEDCQYNFNLTNCDKDILNQTNDCVAYERIKKYLEDMIKLICDQRLPQPDGVNAEVTSECWTGDQTWSLFKINGLAGDRFEEFRFASNTAINIYNQVKEDMQTGIDLDEDLRDENGLPINNKRKKKKPKPAITFVTKRLLEQLVNALQLIQNPTYCKDYRCTISQNLHFDAKTKVENGAWISAQGGKRLRTLKFMCMNPAVIFAQLAKMTRCIILASGTLSPTSTFESELGTKFIHKLSANHVVPKEQVYVRGIPCGPTGAVLKATYKNVHTLAFKDDLGRLVLEVCENVPHGVLCFFSSYSTMESQLARWKETGTWNEIERHKYILTEPKKNFDLEEVMSEFREIIKDTGERPAVCGITGALLFAVFRGKVSEGIDFSDNEARAVLTIGIPYAVQNDPQIKLKREYNDQNRHKGLLPGGEWYSVQAYRALNQALGRCIRHRNDWGAVLLVDERLLTPYSANYLPKWIREMRLDGIDYNLKEELKAFVIRQQIKDKERAAQ